MLGRNGDFLVVIGHLGCFDIEYQLIIAEDNLVNTLTTTTHTFLGPLIHMGATGVANTWMHRHADMLEEGLHWLTLGGNLALADARTDVDLLVLADRAPNELFFGVAYGKLIDAMAMRNQPMLSPAHHVRFTAGPRSKVVNFLYDKVLAYGHSLELAAEQRDSEFFDEQVTAQSRSDFDTLIRQAAVAPDPFTLGQMTSWILTAHRLLHPNLYTKELDRLNLNDVDDFTLTSYCHPRNAGNVPSGRNMPLASHVFDALNS